MAEQIDRDRFIALLTERYPAVAADIDECARGLLHLEMGALAVLTAPSWLGGMTVTLTPETGPSLFWGSILVAAISGLVVSR